jgi:chromosome segregation ATPase
MCESELERHQPELSRPTTPVSELERTMTEFCTPQIERLMERLSELERGKTEYYEPEITRLNIQLSKYRTDQTELRREVQDQRARVLYYCELVSLLAAQIDPLHARTEELKARVRELQVRLSTYAWLDGFRKRLERLYTVPLIGSALRGFFGALIRIIGRL